MTSGLIMRNRWRSFPGTDPLMLWTLAMPAPGAAEVRRAVGDFLGVGRQTGLLIAGDGAWVPDGEPLPWESVVKAGGLVPFTSRVCVRDGNGSVVEHATGNAGHLLTAVERLDAADARRIAAPRPFVAAWTTSKLATLTFSVAFFTTLWIDVSDRDLLALNTKRLEAFRAALAELARRHSGRLTATLPSA
jgi:hypothetical protein